ncbi:ABC transporter ATP-binding protein [Paenalkalicoccus suaedae]|uniref:ABC transporter ATP-binding protein n=1 Tax=Paenalkalicoccus suaedae TaxID=2592382 RepID=A0A859FAY6_9BACI|nr:energy-coupling factor transporter ATPase [Paenalkalicoccus suaedae]QKS70429.1 ABC transporter ATP-binding protein [Paenalkalicoccus suaedae]
MSVKSPNTLVQAVNYSFSYEQDHPLLNNLSLTISEGETTILAGASGSGKSTLALCLNGLYPEAVEGYSTGELFFRDKSVTSFEKGELNQQIGIVFQDPESQFCMLKVEDELAFTLENIETPREEMADLISDVLEKIGITKLRHRDIHSLSGGQKQKVALAAVLLLKPTMLILDEPTANLDPQSRLEFVELIERLSMTTLIIDHQLEDWLRFTDRMLVLSRSGELVLEGKPMELLRKHKNELEAEGITFSPVYEELPHVDHGSEILRVQNLQFKRKKNVILTNIDFSIHEKEFVAIVGGNGAGKSTMLQLLSRLLKPTRGSIELHGTAITSFQELELREKMGFVFQNPEHQFITDSVEEEVAFGMEVRDESGIGARVDDLLQRFHLKNHRRANPFSLSGGQKRRLSVATMLHEGQDILLFDEPTFGQDARTSSELLKIVKSLQEQGTAIVFVTHDMDLVDQYCDRALVFHEQELAFDGSPEELFHNEALLQAARLRKPYRMRQALEVVGQ